MAPHDGSITARHLGQDPGDLFLLGRAFYEAALKKTIEREQRMINRGAKRLWGLRTRIRTRAYCQAERAATRELLARSLEQQRRYREVLSETQAECLSLCLGLAREVIESEFSARPELLGQRIARAIAVMLERRSLVVEVPAQASSEVTERLKKMLPEERFAVVASDNLKPGRAVIKTISGRIELDWEAQLNLLSAQTNPGI